MLITVRPYTLDDVEAIHEGVLDSLDHLRPWMPWVALEPLTLQQRHDLVAGWLRDGAENLGIWADGTYVGGTGTHDRIGPGGVEIGYWVRVGWTGRGVATEAARQVTELALARPGIDRVEIHHDKANVASRRVPEKLGYALIEERPDEIAAPGEVGIELVWRITR